MANILSVVKGKFFKKIIGKACLSGYKEQVDYLKNCTGIFYPCAICLLPVLVMLLVFQFRKQ